MAFSIISNTNLKRKEYLCETESDIALLPRHGVRGTLDTKIYGKTVNDPCAIGSTALVCSPTNVYILAPNNEWVKL